MRTRTSSKYQNWIWGTLVISFAIAYWSTTHRSPAVPEIDVFGAKDLIDAGAVVIDVREREASSGSHVQGALLIPLGVLAQRVTELSLDKAKPVIVYCGDGDARGPEGTEVLQQAGYSRAVNMKQGIQGWRAAGLPTQGS
jgi:rhodanese-related sulfurtransferase